MPDPKAMIFEDSTGLKYSVPGDKLNAFQNRMKAAGVEVFESGYGPTDMDAGVPYESEDADAGVEDADAGMSYTVAPQGPGEKLLSDIEHGVPGKRLDAPPREPFGALESLGRGYLDQAGFGHSDEMAGGGAMADELALRTGANKVIDPVLRFLGADIPMRQGPIEHATHRGYGAPTQDLSKTLALSGHDATADYLGNDKQAYAAHPAAYIAGSVTAGVPQAIAMRGLGGASRAAEAEAAAARSGTGIAGWAERTIAGGKDALTNPGNLLSAALSGHGHAEGETARDTARSGFQGFAGEYLGGAAAAPFAEALLTPGRMWGRATMKTLEDSGSNAAAVDFRSALNAGAQPETFAKPKKFVGGGVTSEEGLRPGPEMAEQYAHSASLGSAQPAEDLRMHAADRLTGAVESERAEAVGWIRSNKAAYFESPEGTREIPASLVLDRVPDRSARVRIEGKLRPAPYSEPPLPFSRTPGAYTQQSGRMINAKELDSIIQAADDQAKTYSGKVEVGPARDFAEYVAYLREVRDQEFPGLAEIDAAGHGLLSRWEAKASQLGIDQRVSGVDTTEGSQHAQAVYNRLGQPENPMTKRAINGLAAQDPEVAPLTQRSQGISAQQRLVAGAKQADKTPLVKVGPIKLGGMDLSPGMRVAGMQNLGLNSQGALRGGMTAGAPVTPAEWQMLMRLLGQDPNTQQEQR